jgi:hypothetical protein
MLMKSPTFIACLMAIGLAAMHPARAAGVLAYQIEQGGKKSEQTLNVQNGQAWVNGVWGDKNLDVLFDNSRMEAIVIDHGRQRYIPVTDDSVRKLTGRLEGMSYMLKGLNDQLQQLNPEQKAKWGMLLDGLPLDAINEAQKELAGYELKSMSKGQFANGIRCEWIRLTPGRSAPVEFCLADADAFGLAEADRETLKGVVRFSQLLLQRAQGLASRFGFKISQKDLDTLAGIPVIVKDRRGQPSLTMTLTGIGAPTARLSPPTVPENYRSEGLKPWW